MNAKLIIFLAFTFAFVLDLYADSATWNLNPATNKWNTAANWTPPTVPDGPADVATFGISNQTSVFLIEAVELDQIVFDAGASAFTITCGPFDHFDMTGTGMINNSGINQTFVTEVIEGQLGVGVIEFHNSATWILALADSAGRSNDIIQLPERIEFPLELVLVVAER